MISSIDHAQHTPYSDPGRHLRLLTEVPPDIDSVSGIARNVIVHYRASGHELPTSNRNDINARWLEQILTIDQHRHQSALDLPREPTSRVQGCCRDHALLSLGILRSHGVPARSRVGFAGYFTDGWHHDHVIVEAYFADRWVRFDPEVDAPRTGLDNPHDIGHCALDSSGFVTAAQVWAGYRAGDLDPETYGVDPMVPVFRGERFIFDEIIYEVAHRFGDELLLWDLWGRIGEPGSAVDDTDARWADQITALLLAADAHDIEAEHRLLETYRSDAGLHVGPSVVQASPFGEPDIEVRLDDSVPQRLGLNDR